MLASGIRIEVIHLIPLASIQHNLYDIHHCCVYSARLLMMERDTVRNMYSPIRKINLRN